MTTISAFSRSPYSAPLKAAPKFGAKPVDDSSSEDKPDWSRYFNKPDEVVDDGNSGNEDSIRNIGSYYNDSQTIAGTPKGITIALRNLRDDVPLLVGRAKTHAGADYLEHGFGKLATLFLGGDSMSFPGCPNRI